MIKNNYRHIMCALALTTSLIATNLQPAFAETVNNAAEPVSDSDQAMSAALQNIVGKAAINISINGAVVTKQEDAMAAIKMKIGEAITEEGLKQDQRSIYELGSYYDVVTSFEVVPEGVRIIYTIVENPVLKDVVIKGNTKLTTEDILAILSMKNTEVINTRTLGAKARVIEETYREKGYIFAKVSDVNMAQDGVLTLTINEGVLEGFAVKGNDKTKERVITREMRLKPGEAFNVKDARRSMQRVYNLGFFDDVNMKLNPGREPNAVVLETDVVERRTGKFAIGGGYSSSDGLVGIIEIGDSNFRGTGDGVNIHWEFGGDADSYDNFQFSYTRPWLDSKQTSGTFRAYNMTNEYDDYEPGGTRVETYDKNYKGFEFSFGRPQSEYSTNYLTFKYRTDEYKNWVEGPLDRHNDEQFLKDNFGNTRSIMLAHVTDTRDNIYNPTEGARTSISGEFAGLMGGDFDYNKYTFEDRHFFKVGRNHVIATKASVGYATGDMPKSALFEAGGQGTMRGYEDDQFQGDKMMLGTVEYRFPIASKVQGAVFSDFGSVWGQDRWQGKYDTGFDLKYSVGIGVQIETPLGPVRLDYGRGEDGGKTHFSFGGNF